MSVWKRYPTLFEKFPLSLIPFIAPLWPLFSPFYRPVSFLVFPLVWNLTLFLFPFFIFFSPNCIGLYPPGEGGGRYFHNTDPFMICVGEPLSLLQFWLNPVVIQWHSTRLCGRASLPATVAAVSGCNTVRLPRVCVGEPLALLQWRLVTCCNTVCTP